MPGRSAASRSGDRPRAALDLIDRSLDLLREASDRWGEAHGLVVRAAILNELGRSDEALHDAAVALGMLETINSQYGRTSAIMERARARAAMGEVDAALSELRDELEQGVDRVPLVRLAAFAAQLERRRGKYEEAHKLLVVGEAICGSLDRTPSTLVYLRAERLHLTLAQGRPLGSSDMTDWLDAQEVEPNETRRVRTAAREAFRRFERGLSLEHGEVPKTMG